MSVNVSTGECVIGGGEGAAQGGYGPARVTSQTNLVVSASNPSNPRIDTVCGTISDSGYTEPTGGSGDQWSLQVVAGTPTSGATLANLNGKATLPLSSLLLAYVLVPASATNIITADIANIATVAQFGNFGNVLGTPTAQGSSTTLTPGQSLIAAPSTTMTLPPAKAGAIVEVIANASVTGSTAVTVSYSSAKIFGVGMSGGVSSFSLGAPYSYAMLASDGTNWEVVAGQQDSGWVAISLGGGVSAGSGYTPAARLRGDRVDLCGSPTGSAITSWGTIPAGLRPASTVSFGPYLSNNTNFVTVTSAGALASVLSMSEIALDNCSYRLS